jgi:putative hydrolase of the HAD superfamily
LSTAIRPALRAVVFDAGGTLLRLDFEWMAQNMARRGHPVTVEQLRAGEAEGRRRYDSSDRRTALPYFRGILAGARVPEALWPEVASDWERLQRETGLWARPMEGAVGAMDAVRAAGLRVAVVSNSDGRAEEHLVSCGFAGRYEFVLDSANEGVEKPDPRIFRRALERLGVAAAEAVYVGDILSVDAAGARSVGMHFVLVDGTGTYGREEPRRIAGLAELPALLAENFMLPNADAITQRGGAT